MVNAIELTALTTYTLVANKIYSVPASFLGGGFKCHFPGSSTKKLSGLFGSYPQVQKPLHFSFVHTLLNIPHSVPHSTQISFFSFSIIRKFCQPLSFACMPLKKRQQAPNRYRILKFYFYPPAKNI